MTDARCSGEATSLRRCARCGGVYPACDRVHIIRGDGSAIECVAATRQTDSGGTDR